MSQTVKLDIAIIGGGIAGLWLLNRLSREGYSCHLFESRALGSDQSVASQGMIHGGIKYTLAGALSGASEAIADMPEHWRACLAGQGDVDLRAARVLSEHFYMWSSASVTSRLTTFFASKATRGRVEKVGKKERPEIFQHRQFSGNLYRLVDLVLDVPSVVRSLADNCPDQCHLIDWQASKLQRDGKRAVLFTEINGKPTRIEAQQFIFSAGKGNAELMQQLDISAPQMQIRPLQQVMVLLDQASGAGPFYGHCLGADKTPRLTISSHPLKTAEGDKWVWYLGGSLAEKGAQQTAADVIACAKQELQNLMPWLDLSNAHWATLPVERAEPRQKSLVRPDKAYAGRAEGIDNVIVAWPTKLTLAPNLASEVVESLGIDKTGGENIDALAAMTAPAVAATPWQQAFNESQ